MSIFNQISPVLLLFLMACQPNPKVYFADDFESYESQQIPGGKWGVDGVGTVLVDEEKAASGSRSIHFVSGEGYAKRAFLTLDNFLPPGINRYYGSMKMYVTKASPDGIHWTMIESSGQVPDQTFRAAIRYGGQQNKHLMANYDTQGVKSDCWQHSSTVIPEGRWFTVSWYFDTEKNHSQLWLDGKLLTDITIEGSGQGCLDNETNGQWLFPTPERLSLGWVDYQTGGGDRSVWIDDVVITAALPE